MLDLLHVGHNLINRKFFGRLPDHLMLVGEIFGSEDFGGLPLFEEEPAAENLGLRSWNFCRGRHVLNL